MNIVILGGRLTRDPELRTTTTGKALARGSIAINRYDGSADFIDIELWNKNAENIAKICKKGDFILVRGEWKKDSFTDKNGIKRYHDYCIVSTFEATGRKAEGGVDAETGYVQDTDFVADEFADVMATDEDLPF